MLTFVRTYSSNADFQKLVVLLDQDLAARDGDEHSFYAQFNKIDTIQHTLVAYENNEAVGCGAFKKFDDTSVEIKRMYVLPQHRNKGVAAAVLQELEQWAKEEGYHYTNYGQYAGIENSVCMKKVL
jgi:putative acetyltransferase